MWILMNRIHRLLYVPRIMKATMERHQHNSTTNVTDHSSAKQVKRFDLRRSITSGSLRTMLTGTGSGFQMALLWTGSGREGGPWV